MTASRSIQLMYRYIVVTFTLTLTPKVLIAESNHKYEEPRIVASVGDSLPRGATFRLGTNRFRHKSPISILTFLPDGRGLISVANENIHIWDTTTGKEIRRLNLNSSDIIAVSISHDGNQLCAADRSGNIGIWEISSGSKVVRRDNVDARCLSYAPVGNTIATGGSDGSISIWDSKTLKNVSKLKVHKDTVRAAIYSPDGRLIISRAADGTVHITNIESGKTFHKFQGHNDDIKGLSLSTQGNILAFAMEGGKIQVWDIRKNESIRVIKNGESSIESICFWPNSEKLLTLSGDNTIRLWSARTGEKLRKSRIDGYLRTTAFAVSTERRIIALGGRDAVIHFCELEDWKKPRQIGPSGHLGAIQGVSFSQDGKIIHTVGQDATFRSWAPDTGRQLSVRQLNHGGSFFLSPDARLVASSGSLSLDSALTLWNTESGKKCCILKGNNAYVCCVGFCNKSNGLASSALDDRTCIWNGCPLKLQYTLPCVKGKGSFCATSLSFSPEDKLLATATIDGPIFLWSAADGKLVHTFSLEEFTYASCLSFSNDGKFLAAGDTRGRVSVWDLNTNRMVQNVECSRDGIMGSVLFSRDSRLLIGGDSCGAVTILELLTGRTISHSKAHQRGISSICCAIDGKTFVTGSLDTTAVIWDLSRMLLTTSELKRPLNSSETLRLWDDLLNLDASVAYRAQWRLASNPRQTVSVFRSKLKPIDNISPEVLRNRINDLDSSSFKVREEASTFLLEYGDLALPLLQKALSKNPTLEVRRRVEHLVARQLKNPPPPTLRTRRAIAILEIMGSTEARQILLTLSKGAPQSYVTMDALSSLDRMLPKK